MAEGGGQAPGATGSASQNQLGQTTVTVAHPESWQTIGAKWMAGQRADTVLLFAILAAIVSLGWYGIQYGIPAHLRQIQSGYETIESSHKGQLEMITGAFEKHSDRQEAMWREIFDMKRSGATAVK